MAGLDDWKRLIEDRLNKVEAKTDSNSAWIRFVTGAGAIVGFFLGLFAKPIVAWLQKLPPPS